MGKREIREARGYAIARASRVLCVLRPGCHGLPAAADLHSPGSCLRINRNVFYRLHLIANEVLAGHSL